MSVLWALVHSLLASKQAKDLARRVAGAHYRDGLADALVCAPARPGAIPGEAALVLALRAGQAASLGVLLSGVRVVGIPEFAGITPLWKLLTGKDISPEPEAQDPPIGADGEVVKSGAFRFTRHLDNLGALGFFLFLPRMTANRAVLTGLVALYVVLGSLHEEHRLQAAYGTAYERYRRTVPFLTPSPSRS
jgi:hypothetical protein